MTIALIISAIVFAFISGFSKAICDLSEEGKLKFKPDTFWIKAKSSANKYQYKNKVAAYLMKTILVGFTDGWHSFQTVLTVGLLSAGFFVGFLTGKTSLYFAFGLIVVYAIRTGVFHIFHDMSDVLKTKK